MGITPTTRRQFLAGMAAACPIAAGTALSPAPALGASAGQGMTTDQLTSLLQELIEARGPVGQEDEVRVLCEREFRKICDEVSIDTAGNVVGLVRGAGKTVDGSKAIHVMAHMDENAMLVKRVNADGTLRVRNLGGINPGNIGQGPVDIIADSGILPGVLSLGPMHSSKETPKAFATRTEAMGWDHVFVFTRMNAAELDKAGVHAGTRVVIARERRKLFPVGDCIGGWFMDDRAAIVIAIGATALLKASGAKPATDVWLVATTQEEIGAFGASYAARVLPGDITVAIDVGPVSPEYGTELSKEPIIVYADATGVYTKSVSDRMLALAREMGMRPQTAAWESYGSDASIAKRNGQTAQCGLLCIATENTHGYEIIPRDGLMTCSRLLAEYLKRPV